MKRHLLLLVGGTAAFWLLVGLPAWFTWGESAVGHSAAAAVLCLVPAAATLAWATWARGRSTEHQMGAVVGGTGLRLLFVLGAGLAVFLLLPGFRSAGFWAWLLVFYLFTLALEMILVLGDGSASSGQAVQPQPDTAARAPRNDHGTQPART